MKYFSVLLTLFLLGCQSNYLLNEDGVKIIDSKLLIEANEFTYIKSISPSIRSQIEIKGKVIEGGDNELISLTINSWGPLSSYIYDDKPIKGVKFALGFNAGELTCFGLVPEVSQKIDDKKWLDEWQCDSELGNLF